MKKEYKYPEFFVKTISVQDIMDGSDVDIDVKDFFEEQQ